MQPNNKINTPRQNIDVESAQFHQFVQTLKQHRSVRTSRLQQSQLNIAQLSHLPLSEQESSPISKELCSERSRSLHMQNNRTSEAVSNIFGGDEALKNKCKFGVANRYRLKECQIPPQYFNPTKAKLQQFLKDSRILSSADISSNEKVLSQNKSKLLNEKQLSYANDSKVMRGNKSEHNFQQLNAEIALKYCLDHQLQQHSSIKQIRLFFVKLVDMVGLSLLEPQIQKYKDGIFFGVGLKKRHIGQGFLYNYSGSLYIGEFLNGEMNGKGVQIFFKIPATYKGDFKQGIMHGYFQVSKDGQKYNGMIQNGLYHGHGKLQTRAGIVQGQFRDGRLIDSTKSMIKQHLNKTNSGFRIRGSSHQHSPNPNLEQHQYVQKNMSFYNNPKLRQPQLNPWSYAQKQAQARKVKPRHYFNDMMQFSYPFGNELPQQRSYQSKQFKGNQINPEIRTSWKKGPGGKIEPKQREYYAVYQRGIVQRTDLAQQEPLQLKC